MKLPELKKSQMNVIVESEKTMSFFMASKRMKKRSAEERSAKDKMYVNKFFETLEETGQTPSVIDRIGKTEKKSANQDCFKQRK